MRTLILLLTLAGCPRDTSPATSVAGSTDTEAPTDTEPPADDCLPTFGDHCGCTPQCMTQAQIDAIGDVCDLECETGAELGWACEQVDGACRLAR